MIASRCCSVRSKVSRRGWRDGWLCLRHMGIWRARLELVLCSGDQGGCEMRKLLIAVALAAACAAWTNAAAQTYPSRPVTIIVPFPAGGPTDTVARILSDHMKGTLGQPVIVENVAGAGASIGITRAV